MAKEGAPKQGAEDLYDVEMAKRIDLARLGFYRQIGRTASEQNFYFESVMNLLIAVAQVPLSFAVLRREGGILRPAFHMCTDKKHQRWFEGLLSSKVFEEGENCFPLFPKVLDCDYCISVWIMHTKTPLRGDLTTLVPFPGDIDWKSLAAGHDPWTFEYVADCAKRFFSDPWDGFDTDFAAFIGQALRNSLQKLERNHTWFATTAEDRSHGANWPPDFASQIRAQKTHKHPNSDKDDWHAHLSKTLGPTIKALEFGTNAVSSLLWNSKRNATDQSGTAKSRNEHDLEGELLKEADFAQDVPIDNFLLMYRAFDRDPEADDGGRHLTNDGAYPYNVRMLLPSWDDPRSDKPMEFFQWLQSEESASGRESAVGGKKWLYSSIIDRPDSVGSSQEAKLRFTLMSILDAWFWSTLRQSDGPKWLVEQLSSPVGNASRSVADPVFNTGLIHYNPMFEFGGLDRVQLEQVPAELTRAALEHFSQVMPDSSSDEIPDELIEKMVRCGGVCKDMRRIVTFFYFASAMVKGGSNRSSAISDNYSGRSMAAVLMPIKIRGSVWAVSLHVTLIDPLGPRHQQSWMANFFLMTNQIEIMNFVIDRALWDNLERRLTDVLAREIGRAATPQEGGFERLEASLTRVNDKLSGENRLVPFVLPKFSVNWKNSAQADRNSIRLFPRDTVGSSEELNSELVLDVEWEIESNPFFVSRQEWTGRTSRSLEPAIRLGLEHGLRELAALRKELLINNHPDRMV